MANSTNKVKFGPARDQAVQIIFTSEFRNSSRAVWNIARFKQDHRSALGRPACFSASLHPIVSKMHHQPVDIHLKSTKDR